MKLTEGWGEAKNDSKGEDDGSIFYLLSKWRPKRSLNKRSSRKKRLLCRLGVARGDVKASNRLVHKAQQNEKPNQHVVIKWLYGSPVLCHQLKRKKQTSFYENISVS